MLKITSITGYALLFSSLTLISTLSSVAQIPSVNCSTFLKQGKTLNWITMMNGLPVSRGTLSVRSTPESGRWSGNQVNQTNGNTNVDLGGTMEGSTMILVNGTYHEEWKGTCNARGIGGQINNSPNVTFVMW
jgi:hypothetical protein